MVGVDRSAGRQPVISIALAKYRNGPILELHFPSGKSLRLSKASDWTTRRLTHVVHTISDLVNSRQHYNV